MKGKINMKKAIAAVLILLLGMSGMVNGSINHAFAASSKDISSAYLSTTIKYLSFSSKNTISYDFNIRKEVMKEGAKYAWYVEKDKGNPEAVTINTNTGVVTAKEAGTAYIGCKIMLSDGNIVKPEAKVIVRNNISEVDISNMPRNQMVTVGESMDFNRAILNTDAGKGKVSKGITRWEITKDTAGIGKIGEDGLVLPTQKGTFVIRAICFQSKEKYNLWIKDKTANQKYITAASKWYTVTAVDPTETTVATQAELDKVLASEKITTITIATKDEVKFIIGKGNYSYKSVVVDAPNADVDNSAVFKNITIKAIKENTWNENADGNSFYVTSVKVRIVINEKAEVKEIVCDGENSVVNIEVEGTVHQVKVLQTSELTMSGSGDQVPITIEKTGEGCKITSSVPIKIEAAVKTEIILQAGAEGSTIIKKDKSVEIKVENKSSQVVVITTENSGEEKIEAGKSGTSNGTAQPTTVPTPTQSPQTGGGTGGGAGGGTGGGAGGGTGGGTGGNGGGSGGSNTSVLQSISIKNPATKTSYLIGESLDITGLVVEGNYSNGSKKTESVKTQDISGFDNSKEALNLRLTITIGGKTVSYTVNVTKAEGPELTGVSSNDTANTLTGMTEEMEFSIDGKAWTTYSADPLNLPDLSGNIDLWVRVTATPTKKAGAAVKFNFSVASLESIKIINPVVIKASYLVGEEIDVTGLNIEGSYSDGSKKILTVKKENISGFDSSNEVEDLVLTITIEGKTTTFTVTVAKAEGPALTDVSSNDTANSLTGMTKEMEFSIDGKAWMAYTSDPSNLPDLSGNIDIWVRIAETETHKAGQTMKFSFKTPPVNEPLTLVSIEVSDASKTKYVIDDVLDLSKLIIIGIYSDGSEKTLSVTKENISGFKSSTSGINTVKITIEGISIFYDFTIEKKPGEELPKELVADDQNNQIKNMNERMEFSLDQINWTMYDETGSTNNLPNLTGDIQLWVRYAERALRQAGPAKLLTFNVRKLSGILIDDSIGKRDYIVGQALDTVELIAYYTYNDGYFEAKQVRYLDNVTFTGYNSSMAGDQTITCEFSVNGDIFTDTYIVHVAPKALVSVSIKGNGIVGHELRMDYLNPAAAGETVRYQWLKGNNSYDINYPIEGATSKTYIPVEEDLGKFIALEVTGTGNYKDTVVSKAIEIIKPIYSVDITLSDDYIFQGETAHVGVEVEKADGASGDVVFSVLNNKEGIIIDHDGNITATEDAKGVYTIIATSVEDGMKKDTCDLVVYNKISVIKREGEVTTTYTGSESTYLVTASKGIIELSEPMLGFSCSDFVVSKNDTVLSPDDYTIIGIDTNKLEIVLSENAFCIDSDILTVEITNWRVRYDYFEENPIIINYWNRIDTQ